MADDFVLPELQDLRAADAGAASAPQPDQFVLPEIALLKAADNQLNVGDKEAYTKSLEQNYQLNVARQNIPQNDPTEYLRQFKAPFVSPVLDWMQTRQHAQAIERYKKGEATPEDIKLIAQQERSDQIRRTESTPAAIFRGLAGLPAVVGEAQAGGAALRGMGLFGRAAPVVEEASRLRQAGSFLGRSAAQTAAMPSMYLEQGAQNLAANPDEPVASAYGRAFLYGMTQTAILGQLANRAQGKSLLNRVATGTPLGMVEQQAADVLGSATGISTGYGLLGDILNKPANEALKHAAVQAVTFAAFSSLHHGEEAKLTVPEALADALKTDGKDSVPAAEAGARAESILSPFEAIHKQLEVDLADPLSAATAFEAAKESWKAAKALMADAELPDHWQKVADAAAKATEPVKPPGPTVDTSKPVEAAKTASASSDVVERMRALNADRTLSISDLRAGMNELESLPKSELNRVATELGFPSIATLSKKVLLQKLRDNLEGIKLSQHRADRIAPDRSEPPTPEGARVSIEPAPVANGGESPAAPAPGPELGGVHPEAARGVAQTVATVENRTPETGTGTKTQTLRPEEVNDLRAAIADLAPEDRDLLLKSDHYKQMLARGFTPGEPTVARSSNETNFSEDIPDLGRLIEESPLSDREKSVLQAYGEKGGLRPAAKTLGVSHETLRKEAMAAFEKWKNALADKYGFDPSMIQSAKSIKDVIARLGEGNKPDAVQPGVLFSGLPFRLTFLDRLFGKENLISKAAAKWLTSAGDLPPDVFAEKVKADGRVAAYAQDVKNTEKDLKAAIGGGYSHLPEGELKTMNAALSGNPTAMMTLRPEVQTVIRQMRDQIDSLSQALIDAGAIQGKLVGVVDANMGAYLHRAYRVFTDPKWAEKVSEDVRNRFKSWMRAEILKDGRIATEDELEGITRNLLYEGKAAETPIAYLSRSKLGSKDLGILTGRKDVPEPLRALWGEFEDPLINYANSVGRMSQLLSNHLFLSKVKEMGKAAGFFSENPTPENTVRIAPDESKVMQPLEGLFTTPEIKRAFEDVYAKEQLSGYMRAYMKVLGLAKYAKTVLSPVTHVRNTFGNTGFLVGNGHWRVRNAPSALKALRDDTDAGRAYYRRLLELGLAGDSVMSKEFERTIRDALDARDLAPYEAMGITTEKGLAAGVKSLAKVSEKLYHAEDLLAKIYAFENEKSRYQEAFPSWSKEQVEQKAAEIVRLTYPTYSNVPRAGKSLRRFPLAGPFVSFSLEVIRTTYHTARLAMAEMRDPATRSIGATRMAGLVVAMGFSAGLAAATRALVGMDRDEEDSLRRFLPEWSRDSQLLHLGKTANGSYKFIDLGRTDPHSYLLEPIQAALRGQNLNDAAIQAGRAALRPFTEEELVTRAALDVMRNKNEQTGGSIYNEQGSSASQILDSAKHLGKVLVPGALEQGRRLLMSAEGIPEQKTGKSYQTGEELSALATGQRIQEVKVGESLGIKAKRFGEAKGEAVKMLNSIAGGRGTVSDKDLQGAYQKMEEGRHRVYDDLRGDVLAAERLGMDRSEIRRTLDKAGVSDQDIADVLNGRYRPYNPQQGWKSLPQGESNRRLGVVRGARQ